jgi:iron-sulfur cluster assembly protein
LIAVLTLTPSAADAIKELVGSADAPDGTGLRIASEPVSESEATLELALTEGPMSGDEVLEDQGVNVFLEAQAAAFLNDKVLDADIENEAVRFKIGEQPA